MFEKLENPNVFKRAIIAVFLASFAYWVYLLFASQMLMDCDAIGYEELGTLIYKKKWLEYFKKGPYREPLFPLTIAFSMRIADIFSISYQLVQKVIHIASLFFTQIIMLIILNKLRINNRIKLITILYFAFSPAIVNTAFCLLSEIILYPFIVAGVLFGALSWKAIYKSGPRQVAILSFATSFSFALAAFGKGMLQYVYLLFLIPYFCILVVSIQKRIKPVMLNSFLYILVGILAINLLVVPYILVKKKYIENVGLGSRSDLLMSNAIKRTKPLTARILLSHIASIPGQGVCRLFFTEEECRYAAFHGADYIFATLPSDTFKDVPGDDIRSKYLFLALRTIRRDPFKYILFTGIEAARMPFWESTALGFVTYPAWLAKLFRTKLFKDGLRFIVSLLTYLSLFYTMITVAKNRRVIFNTWLDERENLIICVLILTFIFGYTGLYSMFSILARFCLPIAPLYLICISYFTDNLIYKRRSRSDG